MFDIGVIAPALAIIAPLALIVFWTLSRPASDNETTPRRQPSGLPCNPVKSPLYRLLVPPSLDRFWMLMTIGYFSVVLVRLVTGYVAPEADDQLALRGLGNLFGLAIMLTILVGIPINALRNRAAIRALRSRENARLS